MKKLTAVLLLVLLLLAFVVTFSNWGGDSPVSHLTAKSTASKATKSSAIPSQTPAPSASATPSDLPGEPPVVTPDPRDAEPVVRAEIQKMLIDIQSLIDEDMIDDAANALRDLRSRELTPDEKKQVDVLQATLNKISN